MLVMSLACDMTSVVSMQWSDTEAKHTFPWLNLPEHHHLYQHDGGLPARGVREDLYLVLADALVLAAGDGHSRHGRAQLAR